MGKRRKAQHKRSKKLTGEAAVAWFNSLRRGRSWDEEWATFLAKPRHQEWWDFHGKAGCLYVTLPDVSRCLAEPFGKHDAVLSERDMRIEVEFFDLCKSFRGDIVGVWGGANIPHPLLGQKSSLSRMCRDNPAMFELEGWPEKHKAVLRSGELDKRSDIVRRNLVRHAGRLACCKDYLDDRDRLRLLARELDLGLSFPLTRAVTNLAPRDPDDIGGGNLEERLRRFADEKRSFLNRWTLMQLTTWDLPVPQGPLEEMPTGVLATLFGRDTVVSSTYPEHFTIPRSDQQENLGRIRFPGSKVEALGRAIEPERPDLYERAYDMWFCEFALRQRFEDMALPRGAVTHLSSSFAHVFEIQEEHVKEIRKLYTFQFA